MLKLLASTVALVVAALVAPVAQAQAAHAVLAERWMIPTPPVPGSYYSYDPTTYLVITNVGSSAAHVTTRVYGQGNMVGPYPQNGPGLERHAEERVGVTVPPGGTVTFRGKIAYSDFQVVLSDAPVIVSAWVLHVPTVGVGGAFIVTDAIALSCSGESAGALACNAPLTALAPPVLAGGSPRARQDPTALAPGEPK